MRRSCCTSAFEKKIRVTNRHEHARIIYDLLAHRFTQASRRDLRRASGLNSCQLFRALMRLEADGVLLAERKGRLAIADRLYTKTGTRKGGDTQHKNNAKHGYRSNQM